MASQVLDYQSVDVELAEEISQFYADPLGFVKFAYPWGEPGPLERYDGPDEWQAEVLRDLGEKVRERKFDGIIPVAPIREAISSGHGIGKTTLAAWIVDWLISTRPNCKGTVTANTFQQLKTKTWAAIQKWTKLCITSHWFEVTGEQIYKKGAKESWFVAAQSCKEENSEAFAGQHAADSTSFYLFDEGSAISDVIFDVAEGGLTDGEPMIFVLGNCTRSTGKFYRVTHGSERHRWSSRTIDSRNARFTNKDQIAEWIQDYGEDSDFVRVRVRGLPPRASDAQFIDMDRVTAAQRRPVFTLPDDPLVAGVDFAWGGDDDNVVRFRRGMDARSIKPLRIKGEFTRDPSVMTNRLADILTGVHNGHRIAMMFVDSAGIAGPIVARLRALGHRNVTEVNFGADSPDAKYVYYRDYMWGKLKEWLLLGAIDDASTNSGQQLEADLIGPGVVPDPRQRVKLESKERMKARGVDSPDDGDALALTFAQSVAPAIPKPTQQYVPVSQWS
jgi:hypothetical protein